MSFDLTEYEDVAARLDKFFAKHPLGSVQSEVIELTDTRVTVKAYAYRGPDDERPGVGLSFLSIPGPSPYTRGSELENAETSARGRALVAIGFGTKASKEEIASKSAATPPGAAEQGTAVEPSRQAPAVPNFIQKAQEAQAERKPAAPNVPVQVGTTKQGKPVYEATTHVRSVQEGRSGWWTISVVLDEGPRDLSTKLQNLIDKAKQLEGTSSVVRWSEQETVKGDKTYVNRYLEDIKVADGVAETFGAAALDDDIPFAPTVF